MMKSGFAITHQRPKRSAGDTFVPMINIVFLLLIFFLLSATIAPPDPFDMALPEATSSEGDQSQGGNTLYVSAAGDLVYEGFQNEAALAAIATRNSAMGALIVRADAGLDGAAFASILSQLSMLGVTDLTVTVRQP